MLPQTLLVAATPFGERLTARRVAAAIARGVGGVGGKPDLCPLEDELPGIGVTTGGGAPADARAQLDALGFDPRMRAARAVIVAAPRLHEDTLAGSFAFEIATRARQAGVPAYAITGENRLDAFDARVLDLQEIVEARTARALSAAGRRLAKLA